MCEDACPGVAVLASTLDIPVISYGCSSVTLADSNLYPAFFRTCPAFADLQLMLEQLLLYFRWTEFAVVTMFESSLLATDDQIEVDNLYSDSILV